MRAHSLNRQESPTGTPSPGNTTEAGSPETTLRKRRASAALAQEENQPQGTIRVGTMPSSQPRTNPAGPMATQPADPPMTQERYQTRGRQRQVQAVSNSNNTSGQSQGPETEDTTMEESIEC